jgi:hypothetical protein
MRSVFGEYPQLDRKVIRRIPGTTDMVTIQRRFRSMLYEHTP